MNISSISTLADIEKFLETSIGWNLKPGKKNETYGWMQGLLSKIRYRKLRKKEKKIVKVFLQKVTGYSEVQLKRLIQRHRAGKLLWKPWQKGIFTSVYDENDIALLHHVDSAHRLSGPATKKIFEREHEVFGHKEFEKLA